MEFKGRIRSLREEKNMTPAELAVIFEPKKSEAAIRAWELGRSKPDADTLITLAKYFNCTTDYLLGLSEYKKLEQHTAFSEEFEKAMAANNSLNLPIDNGLVTCALRCIRWIANLNHYRRNDLAEFIRNIIIQYTNAAGNLTRLYVREPNLKNLEKASDAVSELAFSEWHERGQNEIKTIYMEHLQKYEAENKENGDTRGLFRMISRELDVDTKLLLFSKDDELEEIISEYYENEWQPDNPK